MLMRLFFNCYRYRAVYIKQVYYSTSLEQQLLHREANTYVLSMPLHFRTPNSRHSSKARPPRPIESFETIAEFLLAIHNAIEGTSDI